MNVERILELADFLEGLSANRFSMAVWITRYRRDGALQRPVGELMNECGTCGCLAGWAVAKWTPETVFGVTNFLTAGQEALGLDRPTARALFMPGGLIDDDVTTLQAADVLRNLAETGKVEWERYA